jgi:L,D-transpeptidase YbiS
VEAKLMHIEINTAQQSLILLKGNVVLNTYPVSTAAYGVGEQSGSYQTPRGLHYIRAKIGEGMPINTVFVGRRSTGEHYSPALAQLFPERDWILTRLLWLSGLEKGFNRLGRCDTMQRYIYIHGCPDTAPMGVPASHGCIRMRSADVIQLFDTVGVGTTVMIHA